MIRIDVDCIYTLTIIQLSTRNEIDPFVSLHSKAGIVKRHPDLINLRYQPRAVDGRGATHRLAVPYADQAASIIHLLRLLTRECG
jgi:hypothetical protein